MWLLNAHTRGMREFVSYKQAPHYAILSHTWGDEEVSFKDWQDGAWEHMEQKEGFRKIDGCCRQAVAESLDWVWIDTCCIDKRSSAELSEAINSMFNWYKQADVCYAYLYDVFDDIESNLGRCRWVTRGWTLQELIAPRKVVFYSGDWKAIGTRSELAGRLATITGIDKRFLTGKALGDANVAQRMSWAAKRTTSREEDEAYCLLGIFDVNMPLIYGEGPRAFRRLQEVLAREYPEDHSLFAWGKIVEHLSNQVDNHEQIWGSEPIPYDHNKTGIKRLGLFAESPKDFQHSSQIVDVGTQEKLNTMSFSNIQEAGNYGSSKWREIKYQHNMVQPWDEWRISAIGLADVYISVERFFLDEYESDESLSGNASHHFVDIVDIVVKPNTEDNTVKDDGDRVTHT
ncbi:hypothetical protein NUW58_g2313 [Xylaria curta]|uniref:Uncharacterized protein n=1 Tax=Xylaria curta TaxID=42375 RepID=A0ACC1PG71_9PEZI|nr:hypothetical protein NUW58_g2313 [Xylaria curta]